jgi:hypothetical protein
MENQQQQKIIEPLKPTPIPLPENSKLYELSPALPPVHVTFLDDPILLSLQSTSAPINFSPRPGRKTESRESIDSLSVSRGNNQYQSDLDLSKTYNTPRSKWRHVSDTCSLSSRNSSVEDEDDISYGTSAISNTSLPLTPFKNQVILLFIQVGGHASFLRFSEKALCKPMDARYL